MSSFFTSPSKISFSFLLLLFSYQLCIVTCTEFQVNDHAGWVVPKSKNDNSTYNQWASKNRFKVDDTVHFKYEKDSVLVVTEEEYEKCRSPHPIFFSNNGDTVFKLDRPGLFYFISGVSGHCDRGQKMIIKVLEPASPPLPANETTTASGAVEMAAVSTPTIVMLLTSFVGLLFGLN